MSYYFQGDWINVLVQWKQALENFKAINDQNGVANMLNNLGAVYFSGGDDKSALDYYMESFAWRNPTTTRCGSCRPL